MDANQTPGQFGVADYVDPEDELTGLSRKKQSDAIYLHVYDFSLCRKSKEVKEGWEPVYKTNPNTQQQVVTYVDRYDSVVGYIAYMERFERSFPDTNRKITGINVTILTGPGKKTKIILQLNWIEPVLKRLLKLGKNIDFKRPIKISVFKSTRNENAQTAVAFSQGPPGTHPDEWTNIPEFYGKDNPEVPAPIQDEVDMSWDYKAQNNFLGKRFFAEIMPKMKALADSYGLVIQEPVQQQQAQQQQAPPQNWPPQQQQFQQPVQQQQAPPMAQNDAWIDQRNMQSGFTPTFNPQAQPPQQQQFQQPVQQQQQAPPQGGLPQLPPRQQQQQAPPIQRNDVTGWQNMDPTLPQQAPPVGAPTNNDDDIPF